MSAADQEVKGQRLQLAYAGRWRFEGTKENASQPRTSRFVTQSFEPEITEGKLDERYPTEVATKYHSRLSQIHATTP